MSNCWSSSSSDEEEYPSVSSSSSSSSSSSRSKRLKRSSNTDNKTDRLSALPDPILHHVLSLMDMRDVVQTSLLSRRWRPLWIDVPCLNIHSTSWNSGHRFRNFVNGILLFRGTSTINKFGFHSCTRHCSPSHVENLLRVAERRNVHEVELSFRQNSPRVLLPDFVFTSTSPIQVLKLYIPLSQLPDSLCLAPQLKTLDIESVMLPDGNSKGELVLSCPVLEKLIIWCCDHGYLDTLKISTPQLKNLVVKNSSSSSNRMCSIQISTPNLTSLVLKGCLYYDYSLTNLSSLVNVKLACSDPLRTQNLIRILNGVYNATSIELVAPSLDTSNMLLDHELLLDPFLNLRCLKLIIGCSGGSCIRRIPNLLMNSPCIETLVLGISQVRKAKDWGKLFQCIGCLKSIEIQDIRGGDNEVKFFEFVLKNAVALESFTVTVTVNERYAQNREELVKLNRKIHSLFRASSGVTILFIVEA